MLKPRIFYGVLFIISIFIYIFFSDHIALVFVLVIMLLPIALYFINRSTVRRIDVTIKSSKQALIHEIGSQFEIVIDNSAMFPIINAKILVSFQNSFTNEVMKEEIALSISTSNVTHVNTNIVSQHCGKIIAKIENIEYYDLLLLTSIKKKQKASIAFNVLPTVHTIDNHVQPTTNYSEDSLKYSINKSGSDRSQIYDYHEYAQGDRMKDINWKLSSRLGTLMVKEFSLPISSSVLLMFELSYDSQENCLDEIDAKLEIITSISKWLTSRNLTQYLSWFNLKSSHFYHVLIEKEESLHLALEQIYTASPYQSTLLIDAFHTTNLDNNFSHILYVTSVLSDSILQELIYLHHTAKLTVLFVNDVEKPSIKSIKDTLESNGIELILFSLHSVKNDIQKLIL